MLVTTFGSHPADPTAGAASDEVRSDTLIATVEIESLTVLSTVDDAGVEHPTDSSLVPPVPIRGAREVRIIFRRFGPDDPFAAGVRRPVP